MCRVPVWIEENTCVSSDEGRNYTLLAETMLRPTPPAFVEIRKTNMCGSLLNLSTIAVPWIRGEERRNTFFEVH